MSLVIKKCTGYFCFTRCISDKSQLHAVSFHSYIQLWTTRNPRKLHILPKIFSQILRKYLFHLFHDEANAENDGTFSVHFSELLLANQDLLLSPLHIFSIYTYTKNKDTGMNMMMSVTHAFLLIAALTKQVTAYPTGAGSCHTGNAIPASNSVGITSPHPAVAAGELSEFGLKVTINGEELAAGSTYSMEEDPYAFNILRVEATSASPSAFRGFFMRASSANGYNVQTVLQPVASLFGSTAQVAPACEADEDESVTGVTHFDDKDRVEAEGVLASQADTVFVEITVMITMNEYYYSSYTFEFTGPPSPPTSQSPTSTPTQTATKSPTLSPTSTPSQIPTSKPSMNVDTTKSPTISPVTSDFPVSSDGEKGLRIERTLLGISMVLCSVLSLSLV